jgi:hypothetical protein
VTEQDQGLGRGRRLVRCKWRMLLWLMTWMIWLFVICFDRVCDKMEVWVGVLGVQDISLVGCQESRDERSLHIRLSTSNGML